MMIETRIETQASMSTWAKGSVMSSLTIASTATLRAATISAVGLSQLEAAKRQKKMLNEGGSSDKVVRE